MADPVDNGSFFNLAGLGNLITGVTDAYKTQTLAEDQVRATEEQESAFLLQSAQAVNQVVKQEAVTQLQLQQRQREIQEMSVGKPIDILGLAAMQMLDPLNTTQEGIQQQAAQSQQRTQLAAQMHDANANVSAYRVAHTKAKLASDLGATARALGGLKVQVDAMGTMLQGFAASEQLRLASLEQLPPSKLDALLNSPELARGDEYVMADGFRYSAVELRTKKNNDSIAAAVLALPLDQQNPLLAKAKADQQQLYLSHLSLPALQEIQKNGGQLPNGDIVDGVTLDGHINQAMVRAQTAVDLALKGEQAKLVLPNQFKAGLELVERERSRNHQPGTPLYNAMQQYEMALGATSLVAGNLKPEDEIGKIGVSAQLAAARSAWDEAVMAEANRQASGDKNLAPILYAQLSGQQVDPKMVTDYVTQQFREGKPFSRVFQDSGMSAQLNKEISEHYTRLQTEARQGSFGMTLTSAEQKDMREEAARLGIEKFQVDRATAALNMVETYGFDPKNATSNPLVVKGKMSAADYQQLQAQATQLSAQDATSQFDLPPEAIKWIKDGQAAANGIDPQTAAQVVEIYNSQQLGYMYDLIDQYSPGLAGEYVTWLNTNLVPMAHEVNSMVTPDAADIVTSELHDAANSVRAQWIHADQTRTNRGKQVIENFYSGASNPELMLKAAVLSIRDLADYQKQELLQKVIMPVAKQARENKLTPEQAAQQLMVVLDQGIEGDPLVNQAAKRALRSLPAAISQTNALLNELKNGAMESVEDRERLASRLSGLTTGATPTTQQRAMAEAIVNQPKHWALPHSTAAGAVVPFIQQPGGAEAMVESLRGLK